METYSTEPAPTDGYLHDGRNIAYDALEATRALDRADESTTSRVASLTVDLKWRDLVFDVPIPKVKAPKASDVTAAPTAAGSSKMHADAAPAAYPDPSTEKTPLAPGMRRILHGISGQVRTGQVLAIMGASGSGKTTLLNMLSGRLKSSKRCVTAGQVLVNGHSRDFNTFPQIAKFVEQDDTTMFAELTVREQILYAARLALPASMNEEQKALRADKIVQELGLAKSANTYIGSAIVRGVSGGERRRAAIGVELVTDPSLVFLDEPTTGLDSFNALNVMTSLRHLARNGRTIVTTIHQPRSSIFHMFDMLCLIAEGNTVYFGPAADTVTYFAGLGFHSPPHFNVADFAIDVLSIDFRNPEKEKKSNARIQYLSKSYRENVEPQLLERANAYDVGHTGIEGAKKRGNDLVREFLILARRQVQLISRERQVNLTRLFQTLFFAVLLGLIWLDAGRGTRDAERRAVQGILFFLNINQTFDAGFSIIFSFPTERAIINRERASGLYRDFSYFAGKQICELPRAAFFNVLMLVIVYFMVGLKDTGGAFFTLLGVHILLALGGEGLSQTVSVFAGSEQVAAALVPIALIFQILLGGFFISPMALPGYLRWARYISFIYYAFNAAVRNEFDGGPGTLDQEIVDSLDADLSKGASIAILAAFVFGLKLCFWLAISANKPKFDRKL